MNLASRHRRLANMCSLIERPNATTVAYLREIWDYDGLVKRCQYTNGVPGSVHYFEEALEEYYKAIVRDELNFEALTGYADTYWEWWLNWQSSTVLRETMADAGKQAERYARRTVALAGARTDPMAQSMAQFTLGKVLLATSPAHEAITGISLALEQFKTAVGSAAHSPSFDDMRRSLLQVYRCASEAYLRVGLQGSLEILNGKIVDLVREIQHDEQAWALHTTNGRSSPLDFIGQRPTCGGESGLESF